MFKFGSRESAEDYERRLQRRLGITDDEIDKLRSTRQNRTEQLPEAQERQSEGWNEAISDIQRIRHESPAPQSEGEKPGLRSTDRDETVTGEKASVTDQKDPALQVVPRSGSWLDRQDQKVGEAASPQSEASMDVSSNPQAGEAIGEVEVEADDYVTLDLGPPKTMDEYFKDPAGLKLGKLETTGTAEQTAGGQLDDRQSVEQPEESEAPQSESPENEAQQDVQEPVGEEETPQEKSWLGFVSRWTAGDRSEQEEKVGGETAAPDVDTGEEPQPPTPIDERDPEIAAKAEYDPEAAGSQGETSKTSDDLEPQTQDGLAAASEAPVPEFDEVDEENAPSLEEPAAVVETAAPQDAESFEEISDEPQALENPEVEDLPEQVVDESLAASESEKLTVEPSTAATDDEPPLAEASEAEDLPEQVVDESLAASESEELTAEPSGAAKEEEPPLAEAPEAEDLPEETVEVPLAASEPEEQAEESVFAAREVAAEISEPSSELGEPIAQEYEIEREEGVVTDMDEQHEDSGTYAEPEREKVAATGAGQETSKEEQVFEAAHLDQIAEIKRRQQSANQSASERSDRILVIGPGIRIKGEVATCDTLIVEGHLETDCQAERLGVDERGTFKGSAEVRMAEITGSFDGKLVVSGKLIVRASGKVKGDIRYGRLVIEDGAMVSGTLSGLEAEGRQRVGNAA